MLVTIGDKIALAFKLIHLLRRRVNKHGLYHRILHHHETLRIYCLENIVATPRRFLRE